MNWLGGGVGGGRGARQLESEGGWQCGRVVGADFRQIVFQQKYNISLPEMQDLQSEAGLAAYCHPLADRGGPLVVGGTRPLFIGRRY